MLELAPEISAHLDDGDTAFDRVFSLTGQVFRNVEGRETLRVEIGGRPYFLKRHHGLGWKLIAKTLLACRWPVLSACNEVLAVRALQQAGIPTVEVVGFGDRGHNPATRQSFLLMRELQNCRDLGTLCATWAEHPPAPAYRRAVIDAVANVTRQMHAAGVNHRDFYLCHLWLDRSSMDDVQQLSDGWRSAAPALPAAPRLCVMDLHRAMRRRRVPVWWLAKDLAGLLFSAWDCGLTKSDCVRFVQAYRGRSTREVFASERHLWQVVLWRAARLFRKTYLRKPAMSLNVPRVCRKPRDPIATKTPLTPHGTSDVRSSACLTSDF
jgi:heptose I phosphotransferase